jgi:hypothetical protein
MGGTGRAFGRHAFYLLDVAEAEPLEVRHLQSADRPRGVGEGVRALVSELGCVGGVAGADPI